MFTKLELSTISEALQLSIEHSEEILHNPESYINTKAEDDIDFLNKQQSKKLLDEAIYTDKELLSKVNQMWKEAQ